jgi:hypothetical protein
MWKNANAEDYPYLLVNDTARRNSARTEQAEVPTALIQLAGMDTDDMKASTGPVRRQPGRAFERNQRACHQLAQAAGRDGDVQLHRQPGVRDPLHLRNPRRHDPAGVRHRAHGPHPRRGRRREVEAAVSGSAGRCRADPRPQRHPQGQVRRGRDGRPELRHAAHGSGRGVHAGRRPDRRHQPAAGRDDGLPGGEEPRRAGLGRGHEGVPQDLVGQGLLEPAEGEQPPEKPPHPIRAPRPRPASSTRRRTTKRRRRSSPPPRSRRWCRTPSRR